MFSITSTLILYNALFFICFILCDAAEKTHKKRYVTWCYFLICLISAIRFDIGADYEGYAAMISSIIQEFNDFGWTHVWKNNEFEPSFLLITLLFSHTKEPTAWVYALYSVLDTLFLYRAFERQNAHKWGLCFFFLSGLQFIIWDGLRQGLALVILMNSLEYIQKRKLLKFCAVVLLAFTVHYSSFFFLMAYLVAGFNPNRKSLIGVCLFAFLLAELNMLKGFNSFLISLVPFYYNDYILDERFIDFTYGNPSYVMTTLWSLYLLLALPKSENILANIIAIGAFIHIVAGGILNIDRVGFYFSAFELFAVSTLMKSRKRKITRYVFLVFLVAHYGLFNIHIWSKSYKGCSPYETIFSSEFERKAYRIREYKYR